MSDKTSGQNPIFVDPNNLSEVDSKFSQCFLAVNELIPAHHRVEDAEKTNALKGALENLSALASKAVEKCNVDFTPKKGDLVQAMVEGDFKRLHSAAVTSQAAAEAGLGTLSSPPRPAGTQAPKRVSRDLE